MTRSSLDVTLRKRLSSVFTLEAAFAVPSGFTVIFGPSGGGKTTLLDCIAGLQRPDSGKVVLNEAALFQREEGEPTIDAPVHHRHIGYVFQTLALFPHMTAEANVAYGLRQPRLADPQRRIEELFHDFRISHLLGNKPGQISGGERQRVALARALASEPALLMLDEPLAALDRKTKMKIVEDLRAWNRARQIPILYVTHSYAEAFALGERVIMLVDGRITAAGSPQEVLGAQADSWE